MEVVVHQHKGVQQDAGGDDVVVQLAHHPRPIRVAPEDLRPRVSSGGRVVEGIGEVNSGWSGHARSIQRSPAAGKFWLFRF